MKIISSKNTIFGFKKGDKLIRTKPIIYESGFVDNSYTSIHQAAPIILNKIENRKIYFSYFSKFNNKYYKAIPLDLGSKEGWEFNWKLYER